MIFFRLVSEMQRIVSIVLFTVLIPYFVAAEQTSRRLYISVLDLTPHGISHVVAAQLSDRLRVELHETDRFEVMERERMEEILEEQAFQLSDVCDTEVCAVEIGKLIGVQKMVIGSLGRLGRAYTLSIRMVDVETGIVERTAKEDYRGPVEDLLTVPVPRLAKRLAGLKVRDHGPSKWWYVGAAVLIGSVTTKVIMDRRSGDGTGVIVISVPWAD